MVRLLLRHLGQTLLATWLLASVVFLLTRADGEQAVRLALAPAADLSMPAVSQAEELASRAAARHRLGLDRPLFYVGCSAAGSWEWGGWHNQYHQWLRALLHGNLGTSFRSGELVSHRLAQALAFTLPLTGLAAVLAILAALVLATGMAAFPRWQGPVRTVLVGLHSVPLFIVALALLLLFANPELLNWFPAYGAAPEVGTHALKQFFDALPQLVLPVAALVLAAVPELTLQLASALAHELRQPYIVTARAKGLRASAVVRHHALRNALLPTLAQLAELLPAMAAGAVVVETIFALPGMGRLLAEAAATRDYPLLVGGVLLVGLARLLSLLLADLSYSWADPRIRWKA
ncbi:ABC transporter permease [Hymenobacter glaciei]|uniref:ABC transporter permease n=1 Tax=Hymenobacter glaciei TaxID=877209 RepID=A0ABP7UB62_9BACT